VPLTLDLLPMEIKMLILKHTIKPRLIGLTLNNVRITDPYDFSETSSTWKKGLEVASHQKDQYSMGLPKSNTGWMDLKSSIFRSEFVAIQICKALRNALTNSCYLAINRPEYVHSPENIFVDTKIDQVYFRFGLRYNTPFYMLCGQILDRKTESRLQHIAIDVESNSSYPYNIRRAHLKRWVCLKTITIVMHKKGLCKRDMPGPELDSQLVKVTTHCPDGRVRFGYFQNLVEFLEETLKNCVVNHVPRIELASQQVTVGGRGRDGRPRPTSTGFCCYSV
jgi:hypothetical protein